MGIPAWLAAWTIVAVLGYGSTPPHDAITLPMAIGLSIALCGLVAQARVGRGALAVILQMVGVLAVAAFLEPLA